MILGSRLRQHVAHSFANVKKDTSVLYEWINYLNLRLQRQHNIITQQQQTINALHDHIQSLPSTQHVQQLIRKELPFQQLHLMQQRLQSLHRKVGIVADLHDTTKASIAELQKTSPATSTALQQKLVKNITRNSKSYLKSVILNMIAKYQKISALQLKELVVDEQKLSSKSSFYRILQELEKEGKCEVLKEGKEKVIAEKNTII